MVKTKRRPPSAAHELSHTKQSTTTSKTTQNRIGGSEQKAGGTLKDGYAAPSKLRRVQIQNSATPKPQVPKPRPQGRYATVDSALASLNLSRVSPRIIAELKELCSTQLYESFDKMEGQLADKGVFQRTAFVQDNPLGLLSNGLESTEGVAPNPTLSTGYGGVAAAVVLSAHQNSDGSMYYKASLLTAAENMTIKIKPPRDTVQRRTSTGVTLDRDALRSRLATLSNVSNS